jgi:hypothetical protein
LAAIRTAVGEARSSAETAVDGLALEEKLGPVRKGARIIREISWRWREIGADGRICDLLDAQVSAIEASCGQISSIDPLTPLSAAFDLIEQRIVEFGDGGAAPAQVAEEAVVPSSPPPAPSDEMLAVAETAIVTMASDPEAAIDTPAMAAAEAVAAAEPAEVEVAEAKAEAAPEAADDYDDAMLDMVALEMAAPDFSDGDDIPGADGYEIELADLPPAEPEIALQRPELIVAPAEPLSPIQPPPEAPREISLGSSLIANGIVRKPATSISDPLAPIRRMSQAEKVALFS